MASEGEIKLGRLAIERGLVTEAQVLEALRERNADLAGPDLGVVLVRRGLLDEAARADLARAVAAGAAAAPRERPDVSTDPMIPLEGAREAIARECLDEAQAALRRDPEGARRELRRLAEEFADTESGARARALLEELRR